jgi:hypothetical protein
MAATTAARRSGDHRTDPSRMPRPMRSTEPASSAMRSSFAIVELPRSARAAVMNGPDSGGACTAAPTSASS